MLNQIVPAKSCKGKALQPGHRFSLLKAARADELARRTNWSARARGSASYSVEGGQRPAAELHRFLSCARNLG